MDNRVENPKSVSKGRSRFFLSSTVAALVLFVLTNVALTLVTPETQKVLTARDLTETDSEARQQGTWVWWMTRNYLVDNTDADIAVMGSSQMSAAVYSAEAQHRNEAVDCVIDQQCKMLSDKLKDRLGVAPKVNMFAMGGAMASDHYLVSSALFNEKHKPKLIVVGLNPRDFIDNTLHSASATEPFRFLSPYAELGDLLNCSFRGPLAQLDYLSTEFIAFKKMGKLIQEARPTIAAAVSHLVSNATGKLEQEKDISQLDGEKIASAGAGKAEKDILNAIYGTYAEVKPGVWRIPPTGLNSFTNNMVEYQTRYANPFPKSYEPQKRYFRAFLEEARSKGIGVLVVGMPSLKPNRQLLPQEFWKDFRGSLATICKQEGAVWIDLSNDERFKPRDYIDTVHMNNRGGIKLVDAIADQIASRKRLAACLTDETTSIADGEAGRTPPL